MMKKILLIITLFFAITIPVYAEDGSSSYENGFKSFIEEYEIDFDLLKEKPFETLWSAAEKAVKDTAKQPLYLFGKIAAVLILSSIVNLFAAGQYLPIAKVVNTVSVLLIFSNIFEEFIVLADNVSTAFFEIKNFMISFLPVFAGISFASGEMITSTVYTGFFLICVVTVANFCINYIIPSLNVFMAIGLASSVSGTINLKPVCEFYSKAVKASMTAAVSILCFVLSLQTTITQGQDTLAVKTGKMLVTSAVPVIGSALQGAIGSVYASMGVLKGFCGLAGVLVVINLFLPQIVRLVVYWLGYFVLIMMSSIFENHMAENIISVFKDIIEILISMTVLFIILLLFAICIMIKMFQGV